MTINPEKWRISKSGYSIKTGWGDEKKIIAQCPAKPGDMEGYKSWLANAETIVDLYNAEINRYENDHLADNLAQDIRTVDGNHDLGAGALAEKLFALGWVRI